MQKALSNTWRVVGSCLGTYSTYCGYFRIGGYCTYSTLGEIATSRGDSYYYPACIDIATRRVRPRRKAAWTSLSTDPPDFNVPGVATLRRWPTMTERICGALGCTNDADGVTPDGKHTCLDCADKNGKEVKLYEW